MSSALSERSSFDGILGRATRSTPWIKMHSMKISHQLLRSKNGSNQFVSKKNWINMKSIDTVNLRIDRVWANYDHAGRLGARNHLCGPAPLHRAPTFCSCRTQAQGRVLLWLSRWTWSSPPGISRKFLVVPSPNTMSDSWRWRDNSLQQFFWFLACCVGGTRVPPVMEMGKSRSSSTLFRELATR